MNITEFFQQSSGKWFSQRTSHHLAFKQSESGKSELVIEMLAKDDAAVTQLCQQCGVDPALALCGARVTWNGTMEWDKKTQASSTVLVPIADANSANEGQLLQAGNAGKAPTTGRYLIGSDEALTLITDDGTTYSEERLWFASPNLRFRTSVLKQSDGFNMASFCSEIRMISSTSPASSTTAAAER